jgi:hypothetical protein
MAFVNLALGSDNYVDDGPFSTSFDIVHSINLCVSVLEGKSKVFTKLQALRFLVHLVGDIHQPLHVGTGYYRLSGNTVTLVEEPQQAKKLQSDIGGNILFYDGEAELDAFWDTCLVQTMTGSKGCVAEGKVPTDEYQKLVNELNKIVKDDQWKTPGDFHSWAEQWATDSVHQAKSAYEPITLAMSPSQIKVRPASNRSTLRCQARIPLTSWIGGESKLQKQDYIWRNS